MIDLTFDVEIAGRLGVAALAGLAVGIEREWSGHASGPEARFAGARTFLLLGTLGGIAGWLVTGDLLVLAALILGGAMALTVAAYVAAARPGGPAVDGTTEVAALTVLALGTISGLGFPLVTSASVAIMVLALVEKTRIQELIGRIGQREISAALQFAVLALVILPLLPAGPYGPFDSIRPRALWMVVLLFSGLNFLGYLARRAVGETRGLGLTGLLGGLVSSTAVTWSFARQSRREPALSRALAQGVLAACTVLLLRVPILTTILNPPVTWALWRYLLPPLLVGAALVILALRHSSPDAEHTQAQQSPLGLWSALKMAAAFQVVLTAIPFVRELWGTPGVLASAALVGLTDTDAITLSMCRMAGPDGAGAALAAEAVTVAMLSNTVLKLCVATALGSTPFRSRVVPGLAGLALAMGIGLWLAR
ncbi:MAG TPA: MgtC/SapB family protein [Gemmatimonadales bacterium]|nr:MgtC/SapB family protein [Gemmatimonadales bacterium]